MSEWHEQKARANLKKHGVSFDEACTVFDDPVAAIFPDEDHSETECREMIIGYSGIGRLLVVSLVERQSRTIRIISARTATVRERKKHERYKG